MNGTARDGKVDYDTIARRYDAFRGGGGPYLPLLVEMARSHGARNVLEVGAGTGNNTAAFHEAFPAALLIACDLSLGMITRAREKEVPGKWVQADAHHLPLAAGAVDFCFGCYMLHYVSSPAAFFGECARVLRNGCAAFVTASHEFIETHPMNRYFPSFAAIDRARFQPIDVLKEALADAGFGAVSEQRIQASPAPIDQSYLQRVENQFISTYSLLPPGEFTEGLARLRSDIEAKGRLDVELVWESVVLSARKGPR